MGAGRPTTCTPEVIAAAWEYLNTYEVEHEHAVPSVVGLCQVINRSKSAIYNWAQDENNEFVDILRAINEKQELVTFNKALKGEYNASIAKLLLGKHGYHDKQDTSLSGPDGGPLQVANVKRTIVDDTDS
jgi:hypothetical protein